MIIRGLERFWSDFMLNVTPWMHFLCQVAELREELKRRESRWSAASTRSRQRIEALEQEKKEQQEEVKLLEQYRLQQWREDEQAKVQP